MLRVERNSQIQLTGRGIILLLNQDDLVVNKQNRKVIYQSYIQL